MTDLQAKRLHDGLQGQRLPGKSEPSHRRGSWRVALVLLWACACGCTPEPAPTPQGSRIDLSLAKPAPSAAEWLPEHTQRVEAACSACHLLPPADALPRRSWRNAIVSMGDVPRVAGQPELSADDAALAVAYYERRAPEALPEIPPLGTANKLAFRVEHFSPLTGPLPTERIPAVSHVAFVRLGHPEFEDLIVSEMRTSTVLRQAPWKTGPDRAMKPMLGRMNYPARTRIGDIDGNHRLDFVTVGLGDMNPTNERKGSLTISLSGEDGRIRSAPLIQKMARPADVRLVDLDGDGDQDIVTAEFGWRGPGCLRLYENQSGDWKRPQFGTQVLDDRDGFLEVVVTDVNGDALPDLVGLLAQEHEEIVLFLNLGGLRFDRQIAHKAPHPGWGYSSMRAVDLDGDQDLDLVVSNGDTLDDAELKPYHGVSWFENTGNFSLVEHRVVNLYGCERVTTGDVDGDGDLDVVAVSFLPQFRPTVWQERGLPSVVWCEQTSEGWEPRILETEVCLHPSVAVGDYNADGRADIVVGNYVWLGADGQPYQQADCVTLFTQEAQ